jgi:HAD superfamily hydrolase (TIGR01509 family)
MKTAIFDVDGTLVDSVDLHARAWQQAFEHFRHAIPFDKIRSQIGKGGDQLMPIFLSKEEIETRGAEIEKYRGQLFQRDYLPQVRAFPQVRDLFVRLRADGWRLALASSAKKDELGNYKAIARIGDLVEEETSTDDAKKSKPHPDIFQAALKRLGNPPTHDCVVIGDSPYDAEAAGKAGLRSVGVLCGGFPAEQLHAAGFEVLYPDAANLLANYEASLFHRERPPGKAST